MSGSVVSERARAPAHRRWLVVSVVVAIVVAVSLLGMIFLPVNSQSQLLTVQPGTTAYANLTFHGPTWATVHYAHSGSMAMNFGMDGPSGMMFRHGGMMNGDSYSFGTWGGTYRCWAAMNGTGSGPVQVWVNVSWGMF